MVWMSRRRFGACALGCACAGLLVPDANAQVAPTRYRCPPCGCAMDGKDFDAPGICPACGMTLVLTAVADSPAPANPALVVLSPAEQAADLAVFRSAFFELDRAYSKAARATAERRLSLLERTARPVPAAEFLVSLCQITALAQNGHSACFYHRPPRLTLAFGLVAGEFHVLAAPSNHVDLLGARLIGIDGRDMSRVRRAVRSLFGGVPARQDLRGTDTLGRPEYLRALGIAAADDAATYRFMSLAGRIVDRRLSPTARASDWVVLPARERTPWALAEADQPFRWRDAPELDAVVVQMRRNSDAPDRKAADFLEQSETTRLRLRRQNIVLDMRQNGGGDFLTTRDFMEEWPSRVPAPGRFFVLTGPETFSAGIASVAYLKQAGRERVTLIGEPVGDNLMFFAEGRLTRLPHSGAEVSPAGQRDDFTTGCVGYTDCFAALAQPGSPTGTPAELAALIDERFGRRPLTVRTLDPDIRAPWRISDYAAGRDPALQAVAKEVGR